mgnify:CR=1 FL=1
MVYTDDDESLADAEVCGKFLYILHVSAGYCLTVACSDKYYVLAAHHWDSMLSYKM